MFRIENLQVVLPFVTNNWKQIEKLVKNFTLSVPSTETKKENMFGEIFYEKLVRRLTEKNISFEVHEKLVPRQSSGSSSFKISFEVHSRHAHCHLARENSKVDLFHRSKRKPIHFSAEVPMGSQR